MKRLIIIGVIVLLLLAVAQSGWAQAGRAEVRFLHASADAPALDVLLQSLKPFSNILPRQITPYIALPAQTYPVQVVPAEAEQPVLAQGRLDARTGTNYTLVATGAQASLELLVLVDNIAPPPAGRGALRFVHVAPGAPGLNVRLKDGPMLADQIAFRQTSTFVPIDPGRYDIEARAVGSDDVLLTVPGVNVESGKVYTVFGLASADGESTLQAILDVSGASQTQPPLVTPGTATPLASPPGSGTRSPLSPQQTTTATITTTLTTGTPSPSPTRTATPPTSILPTGTVTTSPSPSATPSALASPSLRWPSCCASRPVARRAADLRFVLRTRLFLTNN